MAWTFFTSERLLPGLLQMNSSVCGVKIQTCKLSNYLTLLREEPNGLCLDTMESPDLGSQANQGHCIVLQVRNAGGAWRWIWAKSAESTQSPDSFKSLSLQSQRWASNQKKLCFLTKQKGSARLMLSEDGGWETGHGGRGGEADRRGPRHLLQTEGLLFPKGLGGTWVILA